MERANRIAELREQAQLSQEELAEKAGTTHATIGRLENGKMYLSSKWVWPIAKALKCHPGELFAPLPNPVADPKLAAVFEHARRLSVAELERWLNVGLAMVPAPKKRPRQRRAS